MVYFTVLWLLPVATFVHGQYTRRISLVKNGHDYYGVINVGKNSQPLNTLFDTGSNHVWVVADRKPIGQELGLKQVYTPSSTFVDTGIRYEEKLGTGKISGVRGKDKIVVKPTSGNIDMDVVEFSVVESISDDLKGLYFSTHCALFGLNLVSKELIPGEPTASLDILAKKEPVFGFYYDIIKQSLVFGQPGKDLITSPFSPHDVVKIGDNYNGWNVKITKLRVGKQRESKEYTSEGIRFGQVITRSAAVLAGPKTLFKEIVKYVYKLGSVGGFDEERYYSFDCDYSSYQEIREKLPVVSVFIDDVKMDIEPRFYLQIAKIGEEFQCYCLLVPADIDYVIIGNGFIKKYYTQFDYNKKQVSFALVNYR